MDALRTPDARFANLPGYDYAPRYREQGGLRLHYVDEGPRDAEKTFLCLHGEPTWAYLYRKLLPVFLEAGHRVVAPDFFGFGRSDKPVDEAAYTFDFHRRTLVDFVDALDLQGVVVVCQDWGGILGLTLPMEMPERFAGLFVMNTALPDGTMAPGPGFEAWKAFVARTPDLDVGALMGRAVAGLTDAEAAAYAAPFPDARYLAGVRRFPALVPVTPEMEGAEVVRRARTWLSERWAGPSFLAVGLQDPVLGLPAMRDIQRVIRGAPSPLEIPEGGHFLQEHGAPLATAALNALSTDPG